MKQNSKQSLKRQVAKAMGSLGFGSFARNLQDLINEIENDRLKKHSGISPQALLRGRIIVTDIEKLQIGPQSVVNDNTFLETRGGLTIGRNVHLARGLTIWTVEYSYRNAQHIPFDLGEIDKPVVISDFVWVGANVSILPGVHIGEGAIVGMGAVVIKDVPYCAVVGGNPAKVIGHRDVSTFEQMKAEKRFF